MTDYLVRLQNKFRTNADSFRRIFGVQLRPYWSPVTGFDVIKFDELINPETNESTYDAIARKFGQTGVDIVKNLL